MQEAYISEEEHGKCQKVAEAFREALEGEDLVVLDAGALFDDLWEEWMDSQLLDYAKDTPMVEMEYDQIFRCMPKAMQDSYVLKKQEFMEAAGCGFLSGFARP